MDVKDKLILKAIVTPASVHDSQVFDALIEPGDKVVYADSAYRSAAIDAGLATKNVEPRINEKGTHGHPLSDGQKAGNREKSKIRDRKSVV